jgi:hypothetical protein
MAARLPGLAQTVKADQCRNSLGQVAGVTRVIPGC